MGFIKTLFCGHEYTPNFYKEVKDGKKLHYHYCKKCGKKVYID